MKLHCWLSHVLMRTMGHSVKRSGQGAQMGIEDAGTLAWLLKGLCIDYKSNFTLNDYDKVVEMYEKIRIPRTGQVLDCSKELGMMQELREDLNSQEAIELLIQGELMTNGTMPIMFQGACHHYRDVVDEELRLHELERERIALSAYMPELVESFETEKKREVLTEQEDIRIAFEEMMYGRVHRQ
jgi:hypothetical protein